MPRPRAQKQSPRGPPNLRTSISDSDHQHPRPRTDRHPKPSDGQSIRAAQSDPSNKNKLGTRIANLESQLGLAQDELKSLKDQLDKNPTKHIEETEANSSITYETDELASKKDEIINLLRSQLDEKTLKISSAQAEIDELTMRLTNISQELEMSRANNVHMNEKLEFTEKAKEDLEKEMKRLRVQSEQWRKAADAAASVLAGGMEIDGWRLSDRCGSMDERVGGGYGGYVGSRGGLVGDGDDGFGGGEKRRGSGIRMLGALLKKKGQK